MDRSLEGLDAAGLRPTLRLSDARVLDDEIEPLDHYAVLVDLDLEHAALLAAVSAARLTAPADELDQVALFDVCHD